jgi:hypothetical protein
VELEIGARLTRQAIRHATSRDALGPRAAFRCSCPKKSEAALAASSCRASL